MFSQMQRNRRMRTTTFKDKVKRQIMKQSTPRFYVYFRRNYFGKNCFEYLNA